MSTDFTPLAGLIGGLMIGLSAVVLMLGCGRTAGNSGIFAGLLAAAPRSEITWRAAFVAGIWIGAVTAVATGLYSAGPLQFPPALATLAVGGILVGIGTQLGSGCTSGHGVCGLARLSPRSFVATATFMVVAIAVVFVMRHVI
ncbi:MAG TPA: YeeE/YedE thiosulfate transporter family protein [Kiloniellales bacterium]